MQLSMLPMLDANRVHDVYVSIGSNMGSRIRRLGDAVHALSRIAVYPLRCSPVYETRPVGYTAQADFLNMVVQLQVKKEPQELLSKLLEIEAECGRVRDIRYGPRTLDLDILLYDNSYVCFNHLQIPHPRMWERAFVLVPLADLVPNRKALGGKPIRLLAGALANGGDVRYVGRFW